METTTQTTGTTPAEAASQSQSYVDFLLGPAAEPGSDAAPGSAPAATGQTAATTPGTAPGQTETKETPPAAPPPGEEETAPPPERAAALESLIQQYAKETGLNPEDPAQRKTLNRMASKELFIQKLKADLDTAKRAAAKPAGEAPPVEPELMTAFEKELFSEQKPGAATTAAPGTAQPQGAAPQTGAPPAGTPPAGAPLPRQYGDIGDSWKTPEESLTALNEAWVANDLRKVDEIEAARFVRAFDSRVAPHLLGFIDRMVTERLAGFAKKELGDVIPTVRKTISEQRLSESKEFAIGELRTAGATDIEQMFTAQDGPALKFDGQEWPNSPLNRVLIRHPEIMSIVKSHDDPVKAERATLLARYKLAYQIWKQEASGGVPAAAAQQLVAAGRDMERNQAADRARQTINAGPGATGLGGKPTGDSYIEQLQNLPGALSASSLFG